MLNIILEQMFWVKLEDLTATRHAEQFHHGVHRAHGENLFKTLCELCVLCGEKTVDSFLIITSMSISMLPALHQYPPPAGCSYPLVYVSAPEADRLQPGG